MDANKSYEQMPIKNHIKYGINGYIHRDQALKLPDNNLYKEFIGICNKFENFRNKDFKGKKLLEILEEYDLKVRKIENNRGILNRGMIYKSLNYEGNKINAEIIEVGPL